MAKVSSSIAGFVVALLMGSQAFANASVASSTSVMQAPKKDTSNWSGFFYMSRSNSLVDHQDGTNQSAMEYILRANYKLDSFYFLRFQSGYSQNLQDSTFNDFNDSTLALYATPSPVTRYLMMSYNLGLIAPTSRISKEVNSLQTGVKGGLIVMANPNRLISGLNIVGNLTATRNFHEFETNKAGAVNTAWSYVQTLSVSYELPKGFGLSADFTHQNTWSYQNVMKDAFSFSQEVNYQASSLFNLALGHSNGGSIYKPNGVDSNISLVDENSSLIYVALTTIF